MKRLLPFIILFAMSGQLLAKTTDGVIQKLSSKTVAETSNQLLAVLEKKGFTIFAEINHTKNAKEKNVELNQSKLVIFGNPSIGSQLIKCSPSIGIDLPQKALIWKEGEKVWLTLNHPNYLAKRHKVSECTNLIKKVTRVLELIATETIQ